MIKLLDILREIKINDPSQKLYIDLYSKHGYIYVYKNPWVKQIYPGLEDNKSFIYLDSSGKFWRAEFDNNENNEMELFKNKLRELGIPFETKTKKGINYENQGIIYIYFPKNSPRIEAS